MAPRIRHIATRFALLLGGAALYGIATDQPGLALGAGLGAAVAYTRYRDSRYDDRYDRGRRYDRGYDRYDRYDRGDRYYRGYGVRYDSGYGRYDSEYDRYDRGYSRGSRGRRCD